MIRFSLKNCFFAFAGVATFCCLAADDRATRLRLDALRDQNCTVICTKRGPQFVRDFFLPNYGLKTECIVLYRWTLPSFPSSYESTHAQVSPSLVSMLQREDVPIVAVKRQVEKLEKENYSFRFVEEAEMPAIVSGKQIALGGQARVQLFTSTRHFALTAAMIFSMLILISLCGKRTQE